MPKFSGSYAGGARESHAQPIYCVAWSNDLHIIKEEIPPKQQNERNEGIGKEGEYKKEEQHQSTDGRDPEGTSIITHNDDPHTRSKVCRYMATCGANQLTLYEVEENTTNHNFKEIISSSSPSSKNAVTTTKSKSSSSSSSSPPVSNINSSFRARQLYIDVDTEEIFYSCLFVGRGVGSNFGYGPTHINLDTTSQDDGKGKGKDKDKDRNKGSSKGSGITNNGKNYNYSSNSNDKKRKRQDAGPEFSVQQLTELSKNDGPQLCCVGGRRGIIKVIDTVRMSLLLTLSGHGNEIYDMSINPTNPWLLISASKDESLRLWNIQNTQCLAIFAGHEGHRDAVLSVDWHPLGEMFVSSGMDETIKIWSIEGEEICNAIELDRMGDQENFRTVYHQLPLFSSSMIHTNYVDCVQFVGDLILSKSTTNTIALWKPDLSSSLKSTKDQDKTTILTRKKCNTKFTHLHDYQCSDCDVWYVRFGTNSSCNLLAIGNKAGDLRLFHIDSGKSYNLPSMYCSSTIRQASFSPDDKSIFVVCDDSTLWRYDINFK